MTVKPDRFEDYLDLAAKAKVIVEKCGGKNVRLLTALVAGEATGSFAFIEEADDFAALGAAFDKFMADPEGSAQCRRSTPLPVQSPATRSPSGWTYRSKNLAFSGSKGSIGAETPLGADQQERFKRNGSGLCEQ